MVNKKEKEFEERLPLYREFWAFSTKDQIDIEALMSRWSRSRQSVVSMIGHAANSSRVFWSIVEKYGLEDHNIPPWVNRPEGWVSEQKETTLTPELRNAAESPRDVSAKILQVLDNLRPPPTIPPIPLTMRRTLL